MPRCTPLHYFDIQGSLEILIIVYLRVILDMLHDIPPDGIHCEEVFSLQGELCLDQLRCKHWLQIQPGFLASQPLIQNILQK